MDSLEFQRRRRDKNRVVGLALGALVLLLVVVTIVKWGSMPLTLS